MSWINLSHFERNVLREALTVLAESFGPAEGDTFNARFARHQLKTFQELQERLKEEGAHHQPQYTDVGSFDTTCQTCGNLLRVHVRLDVTSGVYYASGTCGCGSNQLFTPTTKSPFGV